tara:strand:+ start:124 stop:516 length:393 start_codon:yes stop_codon:yes gene_type:complete
LKKYGLSSKIILIEKIKFMKIYHNPRCKKSRETLKLIEEAGISVEIIKYLEKIPSEKELTDVIEKLKIPAVELLRKGETLFKENYKGKKFSNKEWIQVMVKNPKLIERPIVVKGEKAIIGRPPENVKELL